MIDVNWDDNAKASVRELAAYIGQSDKCERYLETFETKKTVADAVEWAKGVWGDYNYGYISYNPNTEQFSYTSSDVNRRWYIVCTRAEFEAYVKEQEAKQKYPPLTQSLIDEAEQEDEKWTHKWNGRKCIVVFTDDYMSWVKGEGLNKLVPTDSLKPIKPTISKDAKRQLELYVQYRVDRYGDYAMKSDLSDYLSHHEII